VISDAAMVTHSVLNMANAGAP